MCSTPGQSPRERCCPRHLARSLMHLEPGFCSIVRSLCLRSVLFSFFSVKTQQPWLVALLGSLLHHLRHSLRGSADKCVHGEHGLPKTWAPQLVSTSLVGFPCWQHALSASDCFTSFGDPMLTEGRETKGMLEKVHRTFTFQV